MGTHPIFESDFDCLTEMRTRDVRILDSIAREKRNERWVASLNRDNFQGDKAEQQEKIFDLLEKEREKRQKLRRSKQEAGILKSKTSKADKKSKKNVRGDHFKKKFRKTFEILFDEEEQRLKRNLKDENEKVISYQTIKAPNSTKPARKLCVVCGDFGKYKCIVCGENAKILTKKRAASNGIFDYEFIFT